MKKILTGLLFLVSMQSFANEYVNYKAECQISGDQASITNIEAEVLPNVLNFNLSITSVKSYVEIVRTKLTSDVIPQNLLDRMSFSKTFSGRYYFLFELGEFESKILLEKLGAIDVPNLPQGFSSGKYFSLSANRLSTSEFRSQIHFSPNQYDGLSYHIDMKCSTTQPGF